MLQGNNKPKVYSVSELTGDIQNLLEENFDFIWLEGEISNFSSPASGHYYMVMKDEKAQIRAVMFRTQARYLKFIPENGMKAIAQGRISVYPPRGEYQIILDYLEPLGVGALALAFEQLKKKLQAQGVFDEHIKKSLPFLPQRVAVITSPTGAAIRDFLKIIERRFANIEILIIPVRVQGDEAIGDIVEAIDFVNRELQVDVIVLTRGGGSLEDLWAFNQEDLALAIRRSGIPVMSAVGHEIDVTISDLASDYRAPTPSAAAELLVVEKESLKNRLKEMEQRIISTISLYIKNRTQELDHYTNRLKDPRRRLADIWMRLDELHQRLVRQTEMKVLNSWQRMTTEWRGLLLHSPLNSIISLEQTLNFKITTLQHTMGIRLDERQMALFTIEKQLNDLSPFSILKRGYSITRKLPEKRILKNALGVLKGDHVKVILAKGELECSVDEVDRDTEI